MPHIISIKTFYTSKHTSLLYFFTFFKRIYFQIAQEEFKQPIIPHKKVSWDLTEKKQDLTEVSIVLMVLTEI